jgi:predicted ATPase
VTFLFTDIEGSTRRWENDRETMRAALVAHDEVLHSAVEAHGGWVFKHTGDGVCAAFGSARAAIDAAVAAQRLLDLPVRMGVATGEAECRGDDYFGPVLNRTARVMAAGHGGQILVAASAAAVVSGADLLDRGEHRLRDLSGVEHLYQVRAEGLGVQFPPLRTLDAVPGNLPVQMTSFVGREIAVQQLCKQVRAQRLVTLTGVGGVGKTRLAVQVAAELAGEFPDGPWLVELAPLADPAAVPDAVAIAVGVTPQAGLTVTQSITQALSGRRLLVVLDNCEHLLDAAADFVEQLLAHSTLVKVLATSREGLRVGAEQLWPVPSLDVAAGAGSAAVELFVERAQAVNPAFVMDDADATAVIEICRRLDGIALAIELAAARMVSMSAQDVRDHLGDRFRLLSGSRRGLERHQTLRQAVQWSYDLLSDDERTVLARCAVFADGFDLPAVTALLLADELDEYRLLDLLDSLVRKSLVTVERDGGRTRFGLLETIRQFGEERLAVTGAITDVRDRHSRYYARLATAYGDAWDGPHQREGTAWVQAEFANLRAAFRWAVDRNALDDAAAIAAHTTRMGLPLQRYEPIGWAEGILEAAAAADLRELPKLYTAAGLCCYTGRPEAAVEHVRAALELETHPRYDSFEHGWTGFWAANAYVFAGRIDRCLEICADLAKQSGLARTLGLCGLVWGLPVVGRAAEARAVADEGLARARSYGNPFFVAFAFYAYGRAFADSDPSRALDALRLGLCYSRDNTIPFFEAIIAQDAARLEAAYGDPAEGLGLFDSTLESFHRSGDHANVAATLGYLAICFEQLGQPEIAVTIYGSARRSTSIVWVIGISVVMDRLKGRLGKDSFDHYVANGEAMSLVDAMAYARHRIEEARRQIGDVT